MINATLNIFFYITPLNLHTAAIFVPVRHFFYTILCEDFCSNLNVTIKAKQHQWGFARLKLTFLIILVVVELDYVYFDLMESFIMLFY